MQFKDLKTSIKGEFGEAIVKDFLESKGFFVYQRDANSSHPIDFFVIAPDRRTCFLLDVKTKAKMKFFDCTGFDDLDASHYNQLSKDLHLPILIYFVDETSQTIYGNNLKKLFTNIYKGYSKEGFKLFDMKAMMPITTITDQQAAEIKNNTRSSYE